MKNEKMLHAIGQVDDDMIEDAVIQPNKKKQPFYRMPAFRRAVAIAACFVLIIGLVFAISGLISFGSHGEPDSPIIGIIGTQGSEPTKEDKPTQGTQPTEGTNPTVDTEPTQGTDPTQPTEPNQGDDNTDYVIVDSVMMDVMSSYAMSCTIPAENGIKDGYIPISLSFGLIEGCELDSAHFDYYPEILLEAGNYDDEEIVTLKKFNTEDIAQSEYNVECVWDEDRMWVIGFVFTHTETINLPLSLFSGDSGRIWIGISEHSTDGSLGEGAHVVLYYTRSENSISLFAEKPSPDSGEENNPDDNTTTLPGDLDVPQPTANLEFWIAENVDGVDFSNFQEKYGMFGGREYYGTGYVPTTDEDGQQVDPEHCVIYTVTSYPDYSDKEQHITGIYISDPNVEFYGISLKCSVAEFIKLIQQQGYSVTEMRGDNYVKAQMGSVWIEFTPEWIRIGVEVTNDQGIIF